MKTTHWTIKYCQKNIKVFYYFLAIYSPKHTSTFQIIPQLSMTPVLVGQLGTGQSTAAATESAMAAADNFAVTKFCSPQFTVLHFERNESWLKSSDVHKSMCRPCTALTESQASLHSSEISTGLLSPAQKQQNSSLLSPCHLSNHCLKAESALKNGFFPASPPKLTPS